MRLYPRSLTGRLALVLALALLLAQAVSFALLVRAQDRAAAERTVYAALLPLAASLEAADLPPRLARRRARRAARRTMVLDAPPEGPRLVRVERTATDVLAERGHAVADLRVVRTDAAGPLGERPGLTVAIQRAPGDWLAASAPAPPRRGARLAPLIAQTVLVYVALLLPVLWIGRQVARPLGTLTAQAQRWRPGRPPATVPETAPADVADLAQAIASMQARIDAGARERDAMLGAIGHDLRTPLTSLRLRAEQIADEGLRAKMTASLDEAARLLDDTLTLARSGHPGGAPVLTDLAALAREAVASAQAAGQRVTLGQVEAVVAPVHPDALRRALGNLIANADRHAGGGIVSVRRGEDHREGDAVRPTVSLNVIDEGPGLPDDFAVEAFRRGEGSRNRATGGAGLGLAIAKRIAEAHGGTLTLGARKRVGMIAAISLPLEPEEGERA